MTQLSYQPAEEARREHRTGARSRVVVKRVVIACVVALSLVPVAYVLVLLAIVWRFESITTDARLQGKNWAHIRNELVPPGFDSSTVRVPIGFDEGGKHFVNYFGLLGQRCDIVFDQNDVATTVRHYDVNGPAEQNP